METSSILGFDMNIHQNYLLNQQTLFQDPLVFE